MCGCVQEANKKHSVNGYIYCNMPDIQAPEGARLRLILIGAGGETDMHTPGFTNLVQHTPTGSTYVVELYPGAAQVVGMNAGVWCSLSLSKGSLGDLGMEGCERNWRPAPQALCYLDMPRNNER